MAVAKKKKSTAAPEKLVIGKYAKSATITAAIKAGQKVQKGASKKMFGKTMYLVEKAGTKAKSPAKSKPKAVSKAKAAPGGKRHVVSKATRVKAAKAAGKAITKDLTAAARSGKKVSRAKVRKDATKAVMATIANGGRKATEAHVVHEKKNGMRRMKTVRRVFTRKDGTSVSFKARVPLGMTVSQLRARAKQEPKKKKFWLRAAAKAKTRTGPTHKDGSVVQRKGAKHYQGCPKGKERLHKGGNKCIAKLSKPMHGCGKTASGKPMMDSIWSTRCVTMATHLRLQRANAGTPLKTVYQLARAKATRIARRMGKKSGSYQPGETPGASIHTRGAMRRAVGYMADSKATRDAVMASRKRKKKSPAKKKASKKAPAKKAKKAAPKKASKKKTATKGRSRSPSRRRMRSPRRSPRRHRW